MSKWAEIRNDYTDGIETTIDAWDTADDNEEGYVIAVVIHATKEVEYKDDDARTDSYAQEMIREVLERIS